MNPEILKRTDLNAFEKLLWHWLAEDESGQPIATGVIANALCQNVWSVRRAVKNLQKKGLITASKIAPSASRFAPSVCKIAPSASETARSASKIAPGASKNAPDVFAPVNERGETPRTGARSHDSHVLHSNTKSHGYMSHGHVRTREPERRPNPAQSAEQKSVVKLSSIITEIMATIPSPQRQKSAITKQVYGWINDPNCEPAIANRVAEAIVLNLIDENEVTMIVAKINAIDKKHNVKNRGAMFLTEFRKLWKSHDLVWGGKSERSNTTR